MTGFEEGLPGAEKEDRIGRGMAELGLGIHGEPGVEQVEFESAQQAMAMVVDKLEANMPSQSDSLAFIRPVIVLFDKVNGATPAPV